MKGFVESLAGSCRGGAVVVEEDAERRRGGRMEDESLLAEFETRSRAISPCGPRPLLVQLLSSSGHARLCKALDLLPVSTPTDTMSTCF